jgi:preprotein translocase subunit SecA
LPPDAEKSEWTWQALVNWANTRFGLNLKEKDLRKIAASDPEELRSGRDDLEEFLNEQAAESFQKIDISQANLSL